VNPFQGSGVIETPFSQTTCDVENLWAAWRDACDDLRDAHRAWLAASVDRRGEAHAVALAAADREAAAADLLSHSVIAARRTHRRQ
jgi:hypothetical protein